MLILTFEMVPGDMYSPYIWTWNEEETQLNSGEEAVGLDSRIFMLTMGMPFYIFFISVVMLIVALVMTCIVVAQKVWVTPPPVEAEGGSGEVE
jgi:hypothetical protein